MTPSWMNAAALLGISGLRPEVVWPFLEFFTIDVVSVLINFINITDHGDEDKNKSIKHALDEQLQEDILWLVI